MPIVTSMSDFDDNNIITADISSGIVASSSSSLPSDDPRILMNSSSSMIMSSPILNKSPSHQQQQNDPQQQFLIKKSTNPFEFLTQYVDSFLQVDSCFPQLNDLLKISPGIVSISGRRDIDYPNLEEYGNSLKNLSQFVGLKTIPLPKVLIEQFGQMVQRCEMGIFTAIGRAWLAIDTNVYLWKYDTGTDVAYYDALSRMIIKVDLVKPKEGVFKSHIKYILVLVTYTEIILLGITFSDLDNIDDMGDLLVIPEPIFTVPTDNVEVKILKSTEDGRIFYGGNDGCLYEIYYQADNSWFGGRNCKKLNHSISALSFLVPKILKNYREIPIIQIEIDRTRNILYTLNEEGDIEVFDLGTDSNSSSTATRVIMKTSQIISKEAMLAASTIDESNFKSIYSINAIEQSESIFINLVAITKTGARLYFTCTSLNSPEQRPNSLTLLHIRLPPGFAASSISHRPNSVQLTYYKRGNFIFISYQNDNKDTLWALSSDSFAFKQDLSELYTIIPLKTRIWSMAEEPNIIEFKPYQSLFFKNKTFALETPASVTQHLEQPKKFIFLTTHGVIIGYKPRLIDQLKQLLLDNQGYDNDACKSFFHLHQQASFQSNPCVFALILACDSQPTGEDKLIEWATAAFFHYGNDIYDSTTATTSPLLLSSPLPSSHHQPYISTPISSNPLMMTPGDQNKFNLPSPGFTDFKMTPILNRYDQQQQQYQSPSSTMHQQQQQQYSNYPLSNCTSKCRALFIYFSRIIRPIWNLKTVKLNHSQTQDGPKDFLTSNISVDEIKIYLLRLNSLYLFIKNNMKLSLMMTTMDQDKFLLNGTTTAGQTTMMMNDQQIMEKNLIYNLFNLIEYCLEVLNLWKLLCIHQFHIIVSNLKKDKQTQLSNMNFKELICSGQEMTTLLASSLVRQFIEDHSTTDIINKRLQDLCPSIYKTENALHAKVHEMVLKAKSLTNEMDRKILLENAMKLCEKIGPRINLQAICDLFQSVHWYEAIVDICLKTARERDPNNLALRYYKSSDKFNDLQGKKIYDQQVECYRLMLDVYGRLVQQSKSLLSPRSGVDAIQQDYTSPEDAKKFAQIMFQNAIKSNDELFHYTLYNWLYEHNQTDKLLEIKSGYLENFLKEKTSSLNDKNPDSNDSIALMDLLWLYYERNGHYIAAAEILAKLAELNSPEISLTKRIEYLSRAIVCLKSLDARFSSNSSFGMIGSVGQILGTLEDKLDVARIQLQLLNTIEKTRPPHYEEAIQILNSSLLNVTILYQDFAKPFNLYEIQLKILHCSGHDNINMIENIWRNILEQLLQSISGQDPETQKTLLKNKIKELASIYLNTEKFFPLELIITTLESANDLNQFESYWLVEILLELKISLLDLFEIYHKIYNSCINYNKSTMNTMNLLEILIYLINQLDRCPLADRQYFASKALDLISGYMLKSNLLFDTTSTSTSSSSSMIGNDSRARKIHMELKKTKEYLERIIK